MYPKRLILIFFVLFGVISSCRKKDVPKVNYADEMRVFIKDLSAYAKMAKPSFYIIPQNGAPLATVTRKKDGTIDEAYLAAIDGQGQENLFYGAQKDDKESPSDERNDVMYYLDLMKDNGVEVFVTDYCKTQEKILDAYNKNESAGYVSYVADQRNLNNIPEYLVNVHNENSEDITTLAEAKNFLYLINPTEKFSSKSDFITKVKETNYDLIIMDKDFDKKSFTPDEITSLKIKKNGGSRLVICYMSIGEAEDYRYYWKAEWSKRKTEPNWLYRENRKWRGNYKVFYWMPEWKKIIYGNEDAYLDQIIGAGYDGVYLDIVDAYSYYEDL